MRADDLHVGMAVQIVAADDFYAYVDGWTGHFTGYTGGYPTVVCYRDGRDPLTFYVPADQLRPFNG